MPSEPKPRIRCAIYPRKSSEEGLEQSFNSLDAQREACRAYIESQKHEGWSPIATHFDDGGYSGGTMDRPALKRLLDEIRESKVDAVVVYKVDRLTRSLSDFAKIIEIFDKHGTSFVSVSQPFNTTTSMGRLTLNVLLSFAQFEREVTGERIRDKIAASKRKGMWMGGVAPLGYAAKNHKLVVQAAEAELVRKIYRQYLKLGCVSKLKTYLEHNGIRSKKRISQTGRKTGDAAYSRGALYNILRNRIYLGEIEHGGQIYPGEHRGILSRELWEQVQTQLRANNHAHRNGSRAAIPSLLAGLLYDEHGNRFTPAHAVKNGKRYRYYVSQSVIRNPGVRHQGLVRIPAAEVENLVRSRLQSFFESSREMEDWFESKRKRNNGALTANILASAEEYSKRLASGAVAETRDLIRGLISRIVVGAASVELILEKQALHTALNKGCPSRFSSTANQNGVLRLKVDARLRRCGGGVRFIIPANFSGQIQFHPRPSLIKAVVRAHDWYGQIVRGERSGSRSIARATGLDERYVSRILQCAFLAPDIVERILNGRQPPNMSLEHVRTPLLIEWETQRRSLGF
jgi:site-specific DNA recombinase